MKIQVQPNRWSCLPTAFAIVLNEDVQKLIGEIGHDGSEIWWPSAQFPNNCRGFHIQEIIDCCLRRKYSLTTIEPRPVLHSPEQKESKEVILKDNHFENILNGSEGVLTGMGCGGNRHAVAWLQDRIIDPAIGGEISLDSFAIQYYHLIKKMDFGLDAK